jgi:hypothetical protein
MKKIFPIFTGVGAAFIIGCASPTATVQTAVGPNPAEPAQADAAGSLVVFSAGETQGNWGWNNEYPDYPITQLPDRAYSGYSIYNASGRLIQTVGNNQAGPIGSEPRMIPLPPGEYNVKAMASVGAGEWTQVPVVIEPGKTTEVHLNRQWLPPANTPGNDLVYSPQGFPMGWNADMSR